MLLKIVTEFREGYLNGRPARGMCFAVCAPLQVHLATLGYDLRLVESDWGHFWLAFPDGTIIDPTADQFPTPDGDPMPPVYIGPLPAWYEK